jgi:hypothetical protein
MCTQKPPHDFSQQLYERYREAFNEYITSKVRAAGLSQALKRTSAQLPLKKTCRPSRPPSLT